MTNLNNPFVGARPYREDDQEKFFGRDREVGELIERIRRSALVVVAGESAAGKTSMLNAAIIPALGMLRNAALETQATRRKVEYFPLLMFRDWAARDRQRSLAQYVWEQVDPDKQLNPTGSEGWRNPLDHQAALEAYAETQRALEQGTASAHTAFRHFARVLAARQGGLFIILDQLEELFRSRMHDTAEVIDFVRSLYSPAEPRITVVLSLREEYLHALRHLDQEVGSLMQRTYFLKAIPRAESAEETIQEIIHQSFENGATPVEQAVVDRITEGCLDIGPHRHARTEFGINDSAEEKDDRRPNDHERRQNLLTLQVVALEFYESLAARDKVGKAETPVTVSEFKQYLEDISTLHGYEDSDHRDVFAKALERWIARSTAGDGEDIGRIRWCAARLAPYLSSGDYKVAVDRARLREEFVSSYSFKPLMRPQDGVSSADVLEALFDRTVEHLSSQERNIIKVSGAGTSSRMELVHDLLGPAMKEWSIKIVDHLKDCLYAPVINLAVDVQLPQQVNNLRSLPADLNFTGSSFTSEHADGRNVDTYTVIERADFSGWILKGAFFHKILFRNCEFSDVNLQGTLFTRCVFEDVTFRRLERRSSQADFRGCIFRDVTFRDSEIDQMSIYSEIYDRINDGPEEHVAQPVQVLDQKSATEKRRKGVVQVLDTIIEANTKVTFKNCEVRLSRLERLQGEGMIEPDAKSTFRYCLWDRDSAKYVSASAFQIISCGTLE